MTIISMTSISKTARNQLLTIALATTALVCSLDGAWAMDATTLPGGEKVIGGEAGFDRSEKGVLNIKQGSDRLLIDWHEGFNIGADATTNFYQPGKDSIVINRVVSKNEDPTRILGNLNANGRVVILDRNGIIFGKDSKLDVGGLIASTGDINDKAFLKGKGKNFTVENIADGKIVNFGQITIADAGLAAFVAPNVRNDGLIVAKMGTVVMGNAKAVTFDLYGDGLMEVSAGKDFEGTKIVNKGKIDVDGGRVLLTTAMVDDVVHNLINVEKISKSETFKIINGKIVLGKDKDAAIKIKDARKAELAELKELRRKEREAKHGSHHPHHPKDKDEVAQPAPAQPAEPDVIEPEAPVAEIPAPVEPEIIVTLPEPEAPVAEIPAPVIPEPETEVALPAMPEPEIIVSLPAPVEPMMPVTPEVVAPAPAPTAPAEVAEIPSAPGKASVARVSRSIKHDQITVKEVAPAPEQLKDLALEIYGIKMPAAAAGKSEKRADAAVRMNALSPAAGACDTDLNQPASCLTVE
jgi:filamentous hemagglutinin family protein